jgi:hypothetical protein
MAMKFHLLMRGPVEHHQALGVAHRQRTQHHRVDEAENGGICAHAERQGENGDDRETGRFAQRAQAIGAHLEGEFPADRSLGLHGIPP